MPFPGYGKLLQQIRAQRRQDYEAAVWSHGSEAEEAPGVERRHGQGFQGSENGPGASDDTSASAAWGRNSDERGLHQGRQ